MKKNFERNVKHNVKDSLFSYLVGTGDSLKKIYLSLHPEDTTVKDSDLTLKEMSSVFTTGIYNDLYFTVRGKTIIFLEVQSTWSDNILLRFLRYYAEELPKMIDNYLVLQYRSKTIESLIAPEFFLLYTGKDKRREKELELSKIFFSERDSLNLKVKVLTKDNADGILKEYTEFCLILDEERQNSETKEEAILKTIDRAKERGLLKAFLKDREIEVMEMMAEDILWEIEIKHQMENTRQDGIEEGIALGEKNGIEKGMEKGRQAGLEEGMKLGEKKGLEKGIALGKKDGLEEGKLVAILSLVKEGLLPLDKAIEKSGLTEEEFKEKLSTV